MSGLRRAYFDLIVKSADLMAAPSEAPTSSGPAVLSKPPAINSAGPSPRPAVTPLKPVVKPMVDVGRPLARPAFQADSRPLTPYERFVRPITSAADSTVQAGAGLVSAARHGLQYVYNVDNPDKTTVTSNPRAIQDYREGMSTGIEDARRGIINLWRSTQMGLAGIGNDTQAYRENAPLPSAGDAAKAYELHSLDEEIKRTQALNPEDLPIIEGAKTTIERYQTAERSAEALAQLVLPSSPISLLGRANRLEKWVDRAAFGEGMVDLVRSRDPEAMSNPQVLDAHTEAAYTELTQNPVLFNGLQQALAGSEVKNPDTAARAVMSTVQNYASTAKLEPGSPEALRALEQGVAASRLFARQNGLDEATTVVRTKALLSGQDFDPTKPPSIDQSTFPNPRNILDGVKPEQQQEISEKFQTVRTLLEDYLNEAKAQSARTGQEWQSNPQAKANAASLVQFQAVSNALENHKGDLVEAVNAMQQAEQGKFSPENANQVANDLIGRGEAPDALTAMGGLFSRMQPGTKALLFGGLAMGVVGMLTSLLGGDSIMGLLMGLLGVGAVGGAGYQLYQSGELGHMIPREMKQRLVEAKLDSPEYKKKIQDNLAGYNQAAGWGDYLKIPKDLQHMGMNTYQAYKNDGLKSVWRGDGFTTQDPREIALEKGVNHPDVPAFAKDEVRQALRKRLFAAQQGGTPR
jgi:hypothetical protein